MSKAAVIPTHEPLSSSPASSDRHSTPQKPSLFTRMSSWMGGIGDGQTTAGTHIDSGQAPALGGDATDQDDDSAVSERIRNFVPRMVLQRLELGPVTAGEMVRTEAAVGFFDISGFTKLSNELAIQEHQDRIKMMATAKERQSSSGIIWGGVGNKFAAATLTGQGLSAEMLTSQLNRMFGSVIEVIERYGGDIIKFVGDAMIVLWTTRPKHSVNRDNTSPLTTLETTHDELDRACLVAASCAVEAIETMNKANSTLGLHVGVAVGSVLQCIVGTPDSRFETFLAGDACSATFRALDIAKVGEIVVPTDTWRRLERIIKARAEASMAPLSSIQAQFHHIDDCFVRIEGVGVQGRTLFDELRTLLRPLPPLPPPTSILAKLVTPFLPKPFVSALDPRQAGARCEMRTLGVLFASITGLTGRSARDTEFLASMQSTMCALVEACTKHGACLRQFVYDDKGFVAVICGGMATVNGLGLEPSTCVVNVVAYLRHAHRSLYDSSKFGITTGRCFCGPVGATTSSGENVAKPNDDEPPLEHQIRRQEYAVVGDAVNLAARLMSKAEVGQVRVDEATRDSTVREGFSFERLADFTPKGKTKPVVNFALMLKDTASGASNTISASKAVANAAVVRTLQSIERAKNGDTQEDDDSTGVEHKGADPFANLDRFVDRGGAFACLRRLCQPANSLDAIETAVIAGGTGHGKTTLLEVCTNCLSTVHVLTLYASCEQTDDQSFSSLPSILSAAARILLHSSKKPSPDPVDAATAVSKKGSRKKQSGMRISLDSAPVLRQRAISRQRSFQQRQLISCSMATIRDEVSPLPGKEEKHVLGDEECALWSDDPVAQPSSLSRRAAPSLPVMQLSRLQETGFLDNRDVSCLLAVLDPHRNKMRTPAGSEPPSELQVCDALQRLLEACAAVGSGAKYRAGEGLALLIDDGHFCDAASCRLLCRIRSRMPLLRIAITHRPPALRRDFDALLAHFGCATDQAVSATSQHRSEITCRERTAPRRRSLAKTTVHPVIDEPPLSERRVAVVSLGPLNRVQLRKLIGSNPIFQGRVVDVQPELVDFVLRRSSGNPYAALAILHDLHEKKVASVDDATGALSLVKDVRDLCFDVPDTVRSAVTTAFDGLDSTKQALLRLASAHGSRIDIACLAYLYWRFFHAPLNTSGSRASSSVAVRLSSARRSMMLTRLRSIGRGFGSAQHDAEFATPPTPNSAARTNNTSRGGSLTFEVHGNIDLESECLELVRLRWLDFDLQSKQSSWSSRRYMDRQPATANWGKFLVFCRDLTRQVIYHQMLAVDRKFVHTQIVNWHAFKLASCAKRTVIDMSPAAKRVGIVVANDVVCQPNFTNSAPQDMALNGEIAYHALCAEQSVLAFYFCVRAFALALRANLTDVAHGYVDDCEGISENHALPECLQAGTQVAMMRAILHVFRADYAEALARLDALSLDKDRRRSRAESCLAQLWSMCRIRSREQRPPRLTTASSRRVEFPSSGVSPSFTLDLPVDNAAIIAYKDYAIAAAEDHFLYARLAHIYEYVKRAHAHILKARLSLQRHIESCLIVEETNANVARGTARNIIFGKSTAPYRIADVKDTATPPSEPPVEMIPFH